MQTKTIILILKKSSSFLEDSSWLGTLFSKFERLNNFVANLLPFITHVVAAIEGNKCEFAVVREEHHVVIDRFVGEVGNKLNGSDIMSINFVIICTNNFCTKIKNGLNGIEVSFDLII